MMQFIFHSKVTGLKESRVTVAAVIDGSKAKFGVSRCSKNDQFIRRVGREKAIERALNSPSIEVHLPKKDVSKWFLATAKGMADVVKFNPELV